MKIAIVSPVLPPSLSGQAIVLYRLLDNIDPNCYIMISSNITDELSESMENSPKLLGKSYFVPYPHTILISWLLKLNYIHIGKLIEEYLIFRINLLKKTFQNENCTHIIACTADLFDPYCAYLAAKKLNIPFFFYAFDDYINQWKNEYERFFAKKNAASIITNAKNIIVPNEYLKSYYDTNFDVNCKVIHNPVNLSQYVGSSNRDMNFSSDSEIKIVYTGSIYGAQIDSINRLLDAIAQLKIKNVRLHVYSPQIWNPDSNNEYFVHHSQLPLSQMTNIQKNAHILFLPLAFNSKYSKNLINTSSPGKMGEYLASGRPILVHAPSDSFVTWYFKEYDCGCVVDSISNYKLGCAIKNIILNKDYREKIISNARNRAIIDFDLNKIKHDFFKLFEMDYS